MPSRRQYLTIAELEEYAEITVTDSDEGLDQISQAEELIDSYVGFQPKAISEEYIGRAQSGSTTSITLESKHCNTFQKGFFINCMVEIIGGTGSGQRKLITASTYEGVLTTETFSTAPDSTSIYKIWQLGKFPRQKDSYFDSQNSPNQYYKSIPEAIKRAVAAQVEYMVNMGDKFFQTDEASKVSESIGDYSYSNNASMATVEKLVAPKAKLLLRGIKNRVGVIVVD